ncbi:MAG: hypothetical protein RQ748_11930, partial [Elusimicrobiales bacterium]|nr:hypothetical protein [Elusimicrobiales bacterium]
MNTPGPDEVRGRILEAISVADGPVTLREIAGHIGDDLSLAAVLDVMETLVRSGDLTTTPDHRYERGPRFTLPPGSLPRVPPSLPPSPGQTQHPVQPGNANGEEWHGAVWTIGWAVFIALLLVHGIAELEGAGGRSTVDASYELGMAFGSILGAGAMTFLVASLVLGWVPVTRRFLPWGAALLVIFLLISDDGIARDRPAYLSSEGRAGAQALREMVADAGNAVEDSRPPEIRRVTGQAASDAARGDRFVWVLNELL